MAISTSLLAEFDRVGEVFTPRQWAKWLLLKENVYDHWMSGATVCDPTAGSGAFLLALLAIARERDHKVTSDHIARLRAVEIKKTLLDEYVHAARREFGVVIPESSIVCADVIRKTPQLQNDILVGNPPWANFTDLPLAYKEALKPHFCEAGLVPNRRSVLLGSSRTDIAALVVKVALGKMLCHGGTAHFYLPLSLFTGDNAHIGFRDYLAFSRNFGVLSVSEFNESKIFPAVATAYCCASFVVDRAHEFPVPYFRQKNGEWVEHEGKPLKCFSDSWLVDEVGSKRVIGESVEVAVSPEQQPRQGINTCGANDVYMFDQIPEEIDRKYMFPLVTNALWKQQDVTPEKWIFLPYDRTTGRVLTADDIQRTKSYKYLLSKQAVLMNRKGTLVNAFVKKGIWWSLLGVGRYSFAPFKVIWKAFGSKEFTPRIVASVDGQPWQGNQAMHAYIPCWTKDDAERICSLLTNPMIGELLTCLNGAGKCNWAQPGKIKKVVSFVLPSEIEARVAAEASLAVS